MNTKHLSYMELALKLASEAAARNEVPVGAIVVDPLKKRILSLSSNRTEELNDATAHAELLALQEAAIKHGGHRLNGCDLYVTLEPCPMCAAAISLARIRRLYFGAPDLKSGGVDHGAKIFNQNTCHHRPEIYRGINEIRSQKLLQQFFASRRG